MKEESSILGMLGVGGLPSMKEDSRIVGMLGVGDSLP